jgi:hypothetical protein
MQWYKVTRGVLVAHLERLLLPTMSDSPVPCLPIVSDLTSSFGGLLGGVFLGFMFYGANCLQM